MQSTGATVPEPSLAQFLEILIADGRAIVSPVPFEGASDDNISDDPALPLLRQLEARNRLDLAGEPPAFCESTALWSARLLYHICQFIACREIGEPEIRAVFAQSCPAARGPDTDWSADLLLRHLPALFRSAKHLSNADPLLDEMKNLATTWPLSSVGIPGLSELKIESFIEHPALAALYVDRIIATADLTRLGEPRVDELLRGALGLHRRLAPELALRLFPEEKLPSELPEVHATS